MTAQFARTQHRGRSGLGPASLEPHAALLIDFDNVTMGIRSDLTKELKNLLNSDIIKGKVAVQRAYADWRRYPQYIVPLAESSVDLIFAPAYGSAKKNATDIRLAIDAIELVFTRPEIGTIILLSGDSDFSSMVLKLKEYGKYVIGVGIRESASDLLVQNCDEYYSYSALTGLTRAGEEVPAVSEDPWELVELALRQMVENDDVMRSDRLKQVLLELDPGFDEKALGFQKFNKFLSEAATRGLLSLRKQDNGQFEIGPPEPNAVVEAAPETREGRRGRGRRGRGRREERRDEGRDEESREAAEPAVAVVAPSAPTAAAPAAAPGPAAPKPEERKPEAAIRPTAAAAPPSVPAEAAKPGKPAPAAEPAKAAPVAADAVRRPPLDLAGSYDLLRRATAELVKRGGQSARDSDVKRRMLELEPGWDESALGFSKFSRFLRQAHDAEIVTLRKGENGIYDVQPGDGDVVPAVDEARGRGRGRGRGRDAEAGRVAEREGGKREREVRQAGDRAVATEPAAAAVATEPAPTKAETTRPASSAQEPTAAKTESTAATEPRASKPEGESAERRPERAAAPSEGRGRGPEPGRGERPRGAAEAAKGQSAAPPASAPAVPPVAPAPRAAPETRPAPPAATPALLFRRGSKGMAARSGPPPLLEGQRAAVRLPGAAATTPAATPASQTATTAATPPAAAAATAGAQPTSVAEQLGLPRDAGEVAKYIATNYRGVGPKSVQSLIDAFGAARLFDALEHEPQRVRELLGGRGERLLDAWRDDVRKRRGEAPPAAARVEAKSRRGGRGHGGARKSESAATTSPNKAPSGTAQSPAAKPSDATTAKRAGRGSGAVAAAAAPAEVAVTSGSGRSGRAPQKTASTRGRRTK